MGTLGPTDTLVDETTPLNEYGVGRYRVRAAPAGDNVVVKTFTAEASSSRSTT
jgi:hypothetical protein